jgi:hypothetical protein
MKTFAGFLVLFLGVTLTGFRSSAQAIAPGYWTADTKFRVDGIPIPDSTGGGCVTAEQAQDPRNTLTKELTKIGCVITEWDMQGNNLQASLLCKNSDVSAKGKITGQFSDKTYHLQGKAQGFYKNFLPSVASIDLTGQWVRDCDANGN